jgi:transcriptional regulator with XRE-family HTH domain
MKKTIQREPTEFGERLRTLRAEKGLSQEELAEQSDLSLGAVGNLERGDAQDPSLSTIKRLAFALGKEVADLVSPPSGTVREAPHRPGLEAFLAAYPRDITERERSTLRGTIFPSDFVCPDTEAFWRLQLASIRTAGQPLSW